MPGGKFLLAALAAAAVSAAMTPLASAQFKSEAFTQQYNEDSAKKTKKDTADVLFSFKEYFGGLSHKNTLKLGTAFAGSTVIVGGQQIYNNQTWKLPIFYGGIGAGLAGGIFCNSTGRNDASKWFFLGAGAFYYASLMDGVLNYTPADFPHPGKATVLSVLCPGLGQIYNNEWWKLPVYLGGMGFAVHMFIDNRTNFNRYTSIYEMATTDPEYDGPITAEQAKYYRNVYRRYRDYSVLAIAAIYLLQIIDANVFAYMHNFEVDENLTLRLEPTVLMPDNQFAFRDAPALGVRMGFTF